MERSFLRFRLKVSLHEDMPFPIRHFTQHQRIFSKTQKLEAPMQESKEKQEIDIDLNTNPSSLFTKHQRIFSFIYSSNFYKHTTPHLHHHDQVSARDYKVSNYTVKIFFCPWQEKRSKTATYIFFQFSKAIYSFHKLSFGQESS